MESVLRATMKENRDLDDIQLDRARKQFWKFDTSGRQVKLMSTYLNSDALERPRYVTRFVFFV